MQMVQIMLNPYEISMLLMIAGSFVYMMFRLVNALEQEKKDKEAKVNK